MNEKNSRSETVGTVGGQALIEGVMMMKKSEGSVAIAVRRENGEIVKKTKTYIPLTVKYKILNIPLLRGFLNFISMMKLSMGTLTESIEMLGLEDDINASAKEGEKEVKKEDMSKMIGIASAVGIILGFALSFVLFFFLPTFLGSTVENAFMNQWEIRLSPFLLSLFEGAIRLAIFIAYLLLVSQMKDIRRTFEYHGAEHMAIYAYEHGEELTAENVRKHSRFHPRCGTSFLIVMILIGVIVGMIIPRDLWFRVLIRLAMFPLVIGVGWEFIRLAGKHSNNALVKIIAAPGMWVQRITTKKPDDSQLEVAITSLKLALKLETAEDTADVKETDGMGKIGDEEHSSEAERIEN